MSIAYQIKRLPVVPGAMDIVIRLNWANILDSTRFSPGKERSIAAAPLSEQHRLQFLVDGHPDADEYDVDRGCRLTQSIDDSTRQFTP